MARQTRSRPAPSRPAAQQSRGAHTQAAPPATRSAPPPAPVPAAAPQQQGPGMLAQMAGTAASVAVGSTMAHGLSSMLFGGKSEAAAPAAPQEQSFSDERRAGGACEIPAKDFTSCLSATSNDMTACSWYLDQLKQCQQASAQY